MEVEEELKNILGADTLDSSSQAYFQQRNAAIKKVYESMSEIDRRYINSKVEQYRQQGFLPEMKLK